MLWDCAKLHRCLNNRTPFMQWMKQAVMSLPERWNDANCIDVGKEQISPRRVAGTVSTGCLTLLLLDLMSTRQTTKPTRYVAYTLLADIVSTACRSAAPHTGGIEVSLVTLQLRLVWHSTGTILGLQALFAEHVPFKRLWESHLGSEIKSRPEHPQCIDLLMALTLAKHKSDDWWNLIGRPLLIAVAQKVTELLEKTMWQDIAVGAKQLWPEPLKGDHNKGLRARTIDPHEYWTALTALKSGTDLGALKLHAMHKKILVRAMCFAHMQSTVDAFAGHNLHWSFAWDPGLHSTQDTLVLTGLCNSVRKIAYGPTINLRRVPEGEMKPIPEVLQHLEKGRNLQRQAALHELIGLDLCLLRGFGIRLTQFAPPETSLLRPLNPGERRIALDDAQHSHSGKGFGIMDAQGNFLGPELPQPQPEAQPESDAQPQPGAQPPSHAQHSIAWCTHWADQGSIGAAGINFLVFELGYRMLLFPDPNHRTWNDIKLDLKRSKAFFYRSLVLMTLVFNLNYSPFLKGSFYDKKRDFFEDWAKTATIEDPLFKKHAHGIATDRGLPFPQTEDDWMRLLNRVKGTKNCKQKGPLVKMMRRRQHTEKHMARCRAK